MRKKIPLPSDPLNACGRVDNTNPQNASIVASNGLVGSLPYSPCSSPSDCVGGTYCINQQCIPVQYNYGDANYGYVSSGQGSSYCPANALTPSGSSVGLFDNCQDIWCTGNSYPTGCALSPSQFGTAGDTNFICTSNWDSPSYSSGNNTVNCCAGISTSTFSCLPSQCPQNPGSADPYDTTGCQGSMAQACTPSTWAPGGQYETQCDQYAAQTSTSGCKGNPNVVPACQSIDNCGAQLVCNAVWNLYNTVPSGQTSPPTPTSSDPFIPKAITLCSKFPGACDSILSQVCSSYTTTDFNPQNWTGNPVDPNGTNLIQTCGCFLPQSQYVTTGGMNTACNTTCAFPGAIPITDSDGNTIRCSGTSCAIDDTTISVINSTLGGINISQTCNGCSGSSGACVCYITVPSVTGQAAVDISQNCGTCFYFDPQTQTATQVPCGSNSGQTCTTTSQCPTGQICSAGYCITPNTGCTSNSQCPSGQVCTNGICQKQSLWSRYKLEIILGIVGIVLLLLLFGILLYVHFSRKRRNAGR